MSIDRKSNNSLPRIVRKFSILSFGTSRHNSHPTSKQEQSSPSSPVEAAATNHSVISMPSLSTGTHNHIEICPTKLRCHLPSILSAHSTKRSQIPKVAASSKFDSNASLNGSSQQPSNQTISSPVATLSASPRSSLDLSSSSTQVSNDTHHSKHMKRGSTFSTLPFSLTMRSSRSSTLSAQSTLSSSASNADSSSDSKTLKAKKSKASSASTFVPSNTVIYSWQAQPEYLASPSSLQAFEELEGLALLDHYSMPNSSIIMASA